MATAAGGAVVQLGAARLEAAAAGLRDKIVARLRSAGFSSVAFDVFGGRDTHLPILQPALSGAGAGEQ